MTHGISLLIVCIFGDIVFYIAGRSDGWRRGWNDAWKLSNRQNHLK